jgi:succinate-semialdehyde dehydrogenase / glutarate-semialdehyde dehydrogenase
MNARIDQPPYQSTNPATGEVLAKFDVFSDEQLEDTLATAERAYRQWRSIPVAQRAALAQRIADVIKARTEELANLATLEMGKPTAEGIEEIEFCVSIFEYYAKHGPSLAADQPIESFSGDRAVIQKRPIGVILGIMPWNFPFYQVARFVAPNLVLGNTVVLKHAESVPQCALALQDIIAHAGSAPPTYQNLFVSHAQIESIIRDQRVQGVSLTGSERAGAAVAAISGKYLKKCVLELGGSDPYVILDSDDVAQAARDAWDARTYNTGQACNSNKRMIVMEDIFDEFVAELTAQAENLQPVNPDQGTTKTYAPLSSRAAAEKLDELVSDAVSKGATLHAGGELGLAPSAYYSPAVLTGVTKEMRAYREELFGPVAVVYSAASDEEALKLANDSDYGLGGAVFSTDENRALGVATELEVGMANVNIWAGEGAEIPFGGVKRSGFGRELGPLGMDEFANKRLLYVK